MSDILSPYSAVLLTSYGGPRQPEDVLPFMCSATAGQDVPDERLLEISQHYQLFGGRSPINERNEALHDALAAGLKRRGYPHPVVIGNHSWTPFFTEIVSALYHDRHDRVVALTTAAYPCYSARRQYREDLAAVMEQVPGVIIDKVGPYPEHDSFISANVDALVTSIQALRSQIGDGVMKVLFVTRSIPVAMSTASANGTPAIRYDAQYIRVASWVAGTAETYPGEHLDWELVYCSHSGSPHTSWLEPDVSDRLAELTGVANMVVAPTGLISDHMGVVYDLDTQARRSAAATDFDCGRAATAGIRPDFIAILADFLLEQATMARGELAPPDHPRLTGPMSCCLPHPQKEQAYVPSASHTH